MKYKVGDKVRYDGGDWWFYGTVSAVFEHSISPCYRLNVDRMEKKSCKFSITQFEYELEAHNEIVDVGRDKRRWKDSEIESLQVPDTKPEKKKRGRRKKIQEPVSELNQEAEPEKVESSSKPKRGRKRDAWQINFALYQNGEKSNAISTWVAQNRREYKTGKLKEVRLDKLLGINFPFEVVRKGKPDNWDHRLDEWKKGERKSKLVQQWKQRSITQYTAGKLSTDRIAKLKEVGILK